MVTGRKPKPTVLKVLHGDRKDRINQDEPAVASEIPECPEHLDELAREEWDRLSVELNDVGLLTKIDRHMLATFCVTWSRWVRAERDVQKYGELLINKEKGTVYTNPQVYVANRAIKQLQSLGAEFGMSPSSRTRVAATSKPKRGIATRKRA